MTARGPDGYLGADGLVHDAEGPCGPPAPGALLRFFDERPCPRCAEGRPSGGAPLLAVDLGVRYLAAAAFAGGRLRGVVKIAPAECARPRGWSPGVPVIVASRAVQWAGEGPLAGSLCGPALAIEIPQDYAGRSAPRQDLARMRAVAVELHRARAKWWPFVVPGRTREPHPSAWKGNVPKEVHRERIAALLDPAERALLGPLEGDHDVWDAVGLGLWVVGRAGRGGTRPR